MGLRQGTWLENSKVLFVSIIDFVYFWTTQASLKQIRKETHINSETSSTDWARFCRDVCVLSYVGDDSQMIGGLDVEVEIDETLIVKRKYNVGRRKIQGWMFGGNERVSRRCFFCDGSGQI